MSQYGLEAQMRMYMQALSGQSNWAWPVGIDQWRAAARRAMSREAWGYVEGAAGTEDTMHENRRALERIRIRSRMLRDVSDRDLSTTLMGQHFSVPFLLAPIGVQEIVHPDGDMASAAAAAASNVPFVLSTVSSFSIEQVAQAMGSARRWFQLYPGRDPEVMKSFLSRAEQAGYSAVVVTVDTTMLGWRPKDLETLYLPFLFGRGIANYTSDPAFRARLQESPGQDPAAAVQEFLRIYVNPAFTWGDLAELRQWTRLPVLVKGLTHPADVSRAQSLGFDGVIVSNHGGRQVDGGVATIAVLPAIRQAVGDTFPILMDSGIRSAQDVFKALALGADAVLLGRPYLYALAVGGQEAVEDLLMQFKAELDLQLALSGHRSISTIESNDVMVRS
ncbi:alpha-hydroxy-acid oxidizing protein [Sulfobacillus harzensis]|uniref:L-lactate oxidase n=1 Tax=Sulfobacillus harzensis TaxID=2729629 RepID=A0A7Y0L756_9FIRM|nr:alpha-hydroxy-acid oxidizing protein [Sulfobacillus harzensis]NMP23154.1 alpha-hydroxy-acid oxidizing protein [Sulfobacillus harzensis]